MKKLINRLLAIAALGVAMNVQAEGPAPTAPIVKGGTMSVSEAQTKPTGVKATLDSWLKDLRRRMDTEAPTHFEAPTGHRHAIDYDGPSAPRLAIR